MDTDSLRCPISVDLLEDFIGHPMSLQQHTAHMINAGRTMRSSAQRLLRGATNEHVDDNGDLVTDDHGRTWLTLNYTYTKWVPVCSRRDM